MHFYLFLTTILAILPEVPRAECLSTSMCAFPTGTASHNTSTHSVIVGAAGRLAFNPPRLDVALGDKVLFEFLALNHTLTQSSLRNPCTWNATGGIDTGFKQFNPSNTSGKFVVEYTVKSSNPLWFFCSQRRPISHCNEGMVFALNPGISFGTFLQAATGTSINVQASNTRISAFSTVPTASNALINTKRPSNSYTQSTESQPTPALNGPSNSYTQSTESQPTPALNGLSTSYTQSIGSQTNPTSTTSELTGTAIPISNGGFRNGGIGLIVFPFVLAVANV
ncbi:hypothetical protein OCU04_004405 [Sclerotinia nivalis]|uniref:Extracellular serine-rich protein n=1 Tax=Sclerotinia nivalis TaxID=352851 RepID=A0A9X0AQC8_9HELO|nr:hypothetical protein OCU04_004405 [Sclerotinia nivalis]